MQRPARLDYNLKFLQTFCVVDSSLRILWVGGDWDDFARQAGGDFATSNNVLATDLTRHISDIETADKVAEMVRTVLRFQRPLRMDYRCDSPQEVRRFRLTIQPLKEGRALMVHDLQDVLRLETPMVEWRYDPIEGDVKCSMCSKVHLPVGWKDPSDLTFPHPPQVRYSICPDCVTRADTAIHAVLRGENLEEMTMSVPKSGITPR